MRKRMNGLAPLHDRIATHVLAAERLHGDDTPVPVLARGRTDTGRLWVYVRDDRPFAGGAPPAALYRYSRDRRGEHRLAAAHGARRLRRRAEEEARPDGHL